MYSLFMMVIHFFFTDNGIESVENRKPTPNKISILFDTTSWNIKREVT